MVFPVDEHGKRRPRAGQVLAYEMLELWEFERGTDEAAAVRSALGDPVANTAGLDVSSLPLVIVGYDQRKIVHHLDEQRADPESALRPIAVVGIDGMSIEPMVEQLTDIVLPPRPLMDDLREAGNTLGTLATHVHRLRRAPQDPALTMMQFLHTRGGEIMPMVDPVARIAYRFPIAELVLGINTIEAQDILEDLAEHELLEARHVDRMFCCPDCGSYRIPVKELCPECHSTNLSVQESIHHFRCGYVAPESEFLSHGRPMCPKCHGAIQHIGVEYNRPGRFTTCHNCNFWATEPQLAAWCAECDRFHSPADLVPMNIHSFAITQRGVQAARTGSWDPSASIAAVEGPAHEVHEEEVAPEQRARSQAYSKELTQLVVELAAQTDRPMTVYRAALLVDTAELDADEASELLADTNRVLREVLRDSDIVVHTRGNEFLLLMPDNADTPAPARQTLEKHVRNKLGLRLRVTAVDTEAAASRVASR